MADSAVLLNIGDMIDLAIGTPEVGVVDFNMLQTVLHCLAQQLRILGKSVELRGSVAALPVGRDNLQTIAIQEYMYDTESTGKAELTPAPPPPEPDTILVVERIKKSDSPDRTPSPRPTPRAPSPPKAAPSAARAPEHSAARKAASLEKLSLVTLSKFNLLEGIVDDLKNRVYGSMPKNEEILQEVRSQTNLKAITDMWTNLNVSSRLEAAEAGIAKLSSLVQDLIGELADMQKNAGAMIDAIGKLSAAAAIPPPAIKAPSVTKMKSAVMAPPAPAAPAGPPAATLEDLAAIQNRLEKLRADLDALTKTFYATVEDIQKEMNVKLSVKPPPPPPPPPPQIIEVKATAPPPQVVVVEKQVPVPAPAAPAAAQAAPAPAPQEPRPPPEPQRRYSGGISELSDRLIMLEKEMKKCCETINKKDGLVKDQLASFQDQLEYLARQVANLTQDLGAGKLSPDLIKDLQGLMQLFQTVQEMQAQLKDVHDTALQLAAEKEDRQHHINALLEQIELLKTIKLDREDMVEALADKADLRMLARKVSHDQFEMACDDLSRGLEHAIGKLSMQEALWQQALDDIQREIEAKLDKVELSPVKEFFNNKLRQLQENLKQMAALRKEAEAAGSKRRLLRDVNCISCDAKAVMPMDSAAPAVPVSKPLPATLSMKPYLSYELDAIRKAQASNIPQRNMHDWETIDKQTKAPQKVRSDTNKHLCNRYCGGSHTTTTPAQRVARLGHFIKQWGPDVLPLSSGLAAGDDGRMYKVSPTEDAVAAAVATSGPGGAAEAPCTPKTPSKKYDFQSTKPLIIAAECRCLEEGGKYAGNTSGTK